VVLILAGVLIGVIAVSLGFIVSMAALYAFFHYFAVVLAMLVTAGIITLGFMVQSWLK
jgi:hypothetical protein